MILWTVNLQVSHKSTLSFSKHRALTVCVLLDKGIIKMHKMVSTLMNLQSKERDWEAYCIMCKPLWSRCVQVINHSNILHCKNKWKMMLFRYGIDNPIWFKSLLCSLTPLYLLFTLSWPIKIFPVFEIDEAVSSLWEADYTVLFSAYTSLHQL